MKKFFFLGFGIGFIFAGSVMFGINNLNKPTKFVEDFIPKAKHIVTDQSKLKSSNFDYLNKSTEKSINLDNLDNITNTKEEVNISKELVENDNVSIIEKGSKTEEKLLINNKKEDKIDKINEIKQEKVKMDDKKEKTVAKKIIKKNEEDVRNSKDVLNNYKVVDINNEIKTEKEKFYIVQLRSTRNKETCVEWYKKIKDTELNIVEKDGWYRLITAKMYPKKEAEALTKDLSKKYSLKAIMKENLE